MINVECIPSTDPEKRDNYPCLKITETGRIVLFVGPKEGYELEGGSKGQWGFLYHTHNWREEEDFQLYHGAVILRNDPLR